MSPYCTRLEKSLTLCKAKESRFPEVPGRALHADLRKYVSRTPPLDRCSLILSKMKCVGAEDGIGPCQRCRRAGVEYVILVRVMCVGDKRFYPVAYLRNIVVDGSLGQSWCRLGFQL
jgi:hypothetical protein